MLGDGGDGGASASEAVVGPCDVLLPRATFQRILSYAAGIGGYSDDVQHEIRGGLQRPSITLGCVSSVRRYFH